jgi:hypothetical protein
MGQQEKEKRHLEKEERRRREANNGRVEGEVYNHKDKTESDNVVKTHAQSATDKQESGTSHESLVNRSVEAVDTQQKVDRPGQAEVLACVKIALEKLEKVDADSKENHKKVNEETKKRKSQIVQEFAQDLERIGFPTCRIAKETNQQLYKKSL